MSIVLQFARGADLASDLIAWFGHGAGFSHVDTVLEGGQLLGARCDRCAGVAPGVQIRPPGYARFARTLVVELPAPDEVRAAYLQFVTSQIGKPYDMRAIAGFASGRSWRDDDAWFCSELVATALEQSGWFLDLLATPAAKIDPDDLLLALSARIPIRDHEIEMERATAR